MDKVSWYMVDYFLIIEIKIVFLVVVMDFKRLSLIKWVVLGDQSPNLENGLL